MFSTATNEQVLAILVQALSPYVGAMMANASVRGMSQRLGLDGVKLGRPEIEKLVDALAPGLHVYVGKEKARAVVTEIWSAVDALGGIS